MHLYLNALHIENFKGVRSADYRFGDETRICGGNATGKSSIVDAFCWLLGNKNANGDAPGSDRFREKPLDANGQEIHGLDTSVTADFTLDGKPFVLRRLQRENWVKKRGAAEAVYQGNASTYWINEVETKAADFADRINAIASGDMFRLLTTLGAFNAMDKRDRRAMLLSMSGVDVDAELLSRPEYAPIAEELSRVGCAVDDLRKVLADRRSKLAKELQLLPARIDEVRRMRPQYGDAEIRDAEYSLRDAEKSLQSCEEAAAALRAGNGEAAELQREILSVETELIAAKRRLSDDFNARRDRLRTALSDAIRRSDTARRSADSFRRTVEDAKRSAAELADQLDQLRADYRRVYTEACPPLDMAETCPTCGQSIPTEKIADALKKHRAAHKADRAARLEKINARGQELKKREQYVSERLRAAEEDLQHAEREVNDADAAQTGAKAALADFPAEVDYSVDQNVEALQSRLTGLRTAKTETPDFRARQFDDRRSELKARIAAARETLAKRDRAKEADARIAELEAQQTQIGQRRAEVEVLISDVERFVSARCGLLEERINEQFPTVRWKLFDRQINGALADCCECMIPGDGALVPYGGANTAARVNADIEIIGVLSRRCDVIAPLFVDNAERVNYVARPAGQLITLSVDNSPALTVTTENVREVA